MIWKRLALLLLPAALSAFAQSQQPTAIDFRFDYLRQQTPLRKQAEVNLPASIRFHSPPAPQLFAALDKLGIKFFQQSGQRLGSATVFPAEVSPGQLEALAQFPEIAAVQPAWRPFHLPPLDVSRPEIQAEEAWQMRGPGERARTGTGVLIADFDTGVDFFHPMLWFADGDTVNWIDGNGNNLFDPGSDAVDLNKNGIFDSGEALRYREMAYTANTAGVYDTDLDFLYNDANDNGQRDFGAARGFTESSPTYGEPWFIALDQNGDRRLNVGERLVALKTCKIRAILETDGTVRRRGVDLILASPDNGPYGGHGTAVAGIAVGGVAGVHRLAGIAPGAEMIFASISYDATPRFFTALPGMMAWAAAEGAQIMLYEDGEWVWEYLDGSSNEEIMINEMAARGIVQVTPAGNLTGGGMQKTVMLSPNDSTQVTFSGNAASDIWPSLRWRGQGEEITVKLQVNSGDFVTLPTTAATLTLGGKAVYSDRSVSARGTVMHILYIAQASAATYTVRLINHTATLRRVEALLGDNGFSWTGIARWNGASETNTVTWPATSDSAIGVAAYRNKSFDTGINSFSGRGLRIDDQHQVDVAAPGSTVYSIGRNNVYAAFGGTSSAGPHVAGAVALLRQSDPALSHGQLRQALRSGAVSDVYTGTVPNTTWGAGKLRIANALRQIPTAVSVRATAPADWELAQNYPNPFNPYTHIAFTLSRPEHITLKVYDLLGQEIATLVDEVRAPGQYQALWQARGVASGIYFYRLSSATISATKKLVLVR